MKYLSYFFMAITSTFLVILLSLSSCQPNSKITTQPSARDSDPTEVPKSQGQAQTATATVKIRNFKFEPANKAIAVGETVQFINLDEEPHTATSTDGAFNSKALDTNQTWNYTALKSGNFPYICSVHPFMKGTLTVTPKKN
jgi:plastocyanin